VTHLSKSIDENEERIVSIRNWKVDDKIAGDAGPRAGRDWKGRELSMFEVAWRLAAGAGIAGADIRFDICGHAREVVIARQ